MSDRDPWVTPAPPAPLDEPPAPRGRPGHQAGDSLFNPAGNAMQAAASLRTVTTVIFGLGLFGTVLTFLLSLGWLAENWSAYGTSLLPGFVALGASVVNLLLLLLLRSFMRTVAAYVALAATRRQ